MNFFVFRSLLLFVICSLISACTSQRSPANEKLQFERLAVFEVPLKQNEKLLVIAVRRLNDDLSQRPFVNARDYTWVPRDLETMDPKFVMLMTGDKVSQIQTFDMGDWSQNRAFGGTARIRRSHTVRQRPLDPGQYAGLPPNLLDVNSPRVDLVTMLSASALNNVLMFTPATPVAGVMRNINKWTESKRRSEASYLGTLLRQSQELDFAALSKNIDPEEVDRVLASLDVRFHPTSTYGGLFIGETARSDYSEKIRAIRKDQAASHYAGLVKAANEQGLWVLPISSHFALLAYDPSSELPVDHWNDFILDVDNPNRLSNDLMRLAKEKRKLIPLGFYSTIQKGTPTKMVDFQYPGSASVERRVNAVIELHKDALSSFVPIPFFSMGLQLVSGAVKLVVKKQGSAFYEDRMESYGELMALVDMGLLKLPMEEIFMENIFSNLKTWGFTEDEVALLRVEWAGLSQDEIARRTQEIFGAVVREESSRALLLDPPTIKRQQITKTVHMKRLDNWIKRKLEGKKDPVRRSFHKSSRKPAGDESAATILFLADGLRPDRLREASKKGLIPNITEHFLDRGAEMTAHTSRSLTLPSWTTILSGFEPDEHGIRSNSPASRLTRGSSESFLDPRKDLLLPKYATQGRSFRRLQESGLTWLPRYFGKEQVALNFMPLNDGAYPPIGTLLSRLATDFSSVWAGTFSGSEVLDSVSYDTVAQTIRKNPGKHRLVVIWHASIDSHSHYSNHQLNWAYEVLDKGIAKILAAAKKDPILKNARTVMISDHGHLGGYEKAHSEYCGQSKEIFIDNTGFNLTKYFAGDFVEARHWDFVVGASESPEPQYDLGYLKEFMIHPFDYTYSGQKKTPGDRSLLVDYSGDNMAQVYVLQRENRFVDKPLNYHQMRNYRRLDRGPKKDMIASILDFRIRNLETSDPELARCIQRQSLNHPVEYLSLSLGSEAFASLRQQLDPRFVRTWLRDPILVQSRMGAGLILTSKSEGGEDWFQYFSLRYFDQDEKGNVSFTLDKSGSNDPLQLISKSVDFEQAALGMSDRDWLRSNVKANSLNPTAPFYFVRALTLSPRLAASAKRVAEKPDFVLLSKRGFSFHSSVAHQGDHGGVHKLETQVSLFVSGLGDESWSHAAHSKEPIFTRDLVPTILEQHGREDLLGLMQGRSFDGHLEDLRELN